MKNEALFGAKGSHSSVISSISVPTATSSVAVAATSAAPAAAVSTITTVSNAAVDMSRLNTIGFKALGTNSQTANGGCWLGSDGPNVNTVTNGAGVPIIVVVWGASGYAASFMSSGIAPYITYGLAAGASTTISCADVSGGMAAVYPDTTLTSFGQIGNTWVEFTWGSWGTVDISKEVTMSGHAVSVSSPVCTTDMNTCVFVCNSGDTCGAAGTYTLKNCSGPNKQSDAAAMNGGCLMGPGAHVSTTFS